MDSITKFMEDFISIPLPKDRMTEKDAYFMLGVMQSFQLRATAILDREKDAKR